MNQMSFKNVFYKILSNEKQREKMTFLKDVGSAYELFCKNGYSKSSAEFKREMNNFLSSADGQKIMNNDFDELSDEMLAMVAGGADLKRFATMCAAALMTASMLSGSMLSVNATDEQTTQSTQQSQAGQEQQAQYTLTKLYSYNDEIETLKQEKEKFEQERDNEIKKLDSEIKEDNAWITSLNALGNDIDQQSKTTLDNLKLEVAKKTKLKENLDKEYNAKILNLNNKIKEQEILRDDKEEKERQKKIDKEKQQLIINIEDYQKTIDELEKNKKQIKKQQEDEIKKLDNEIKGDEQLLDYLNDLKKNGEDQGDNINAVERRINNNKEKVKKMSTNREKEISNLNKLIKEINTEKEKLEKKLNNLLYREEHENIKVEKLDKEKLQNKNENEDIIKEIPFEKLLAGDQHVDNKMIVEKQEIEVKNTCGIHMITTLKNIYDFVGGNKTQPVRGFKNVIDNYLDKGGYAKFLFEPLEEGKVGQALASDDFRDFLENNGIGMNRLDFSETVALTGDKKEDEKTVSNFKRKWKERIAEFLKSYMKGKNFAPVATVGGGHWQLLAKINDQGDKILRLDSAPVEAKWVDLDTVAENFIRYDTLDNENVFFHFEMPIFNQNGNFEDKKIQDTDNFTKEKQQEIINKFI